MCALGQRRVCCVVHCPFVPVAVHPAPGTVHHRIQSAFTPTQHTQVVAQPRHNQGADGEEAEQEKKRFICLCVVWNKSVYSRSPVSGESGDPLCALFVDAHCICMFIRMMSLRPDSQEESAGSTNSFEGHDGARSEGELWG